MVSHVVLDASLISRWANYLHYIYHKNDSWHPLNINVSKCICIHTYIYIYIYVNASSLTLNVIALSLYVYLQYMTRGPLIIWFNFFISAWISNHMSRKVWNKTTHHSQSSMVQSMRFGNRLVFHHTFYNGCKYVSMAWFKLNHVSQRDRRWNLLQSNEYGSHSLWLSNTTGCISWVHVYLWICASLFRNALLWSNFYCYITVSVLVID